MTRRGVEATLAILFAVVILVVGGIAVAVFVTISPVHTDIAAVPSTAAPIQPGSYASAVDESKRLARALVVNENLAGLSVAVAHDGELVWAEGFGFADVERRTSVTPVTRFRLGSVSKTLTAAGVALLHDRGRIDLEAPVQRYVPAYPKKPWTVTTRQLMGDVAGVHRIRGDNNDLLPGRHCTSLDDALTIFADEPLLFRPGTNYRFAIYGWILLTAVVEGAAQEPFQTFMTRDVFEPLGMERTAIEETDAAEDMTSFYFPRAFMRSGLGLHEASANDYSCYAGAGAFLHAVGPGAPGICNGEARAPETRNDRPPADTAPARDWELHRIRAGLESRGRAACRHADTIADSPRHSRRRYYLRHAVPGARIGDCHHLERHACQRCLSVWSEGRGRIREPIAAAIEPLSHRHGRSERTGPTCGCRGKKPPRLCYGHETAP